MAACLQFTRRVWTSFIANGGHDAKCFRNLKVEAAHPNIIRASLKIEKYNVNRIGTVHGGLVLSLTDTVGSLAVSTKGFWMTGVSTDVGTTFVKPAGKVGDTLHITARLISMGKSLAFTRVEFFNPDGDLLAYGHHTKYIAKASHHPENVVFSEDGEMVLSEKDQCKVAFPVSAEVPPS